jgi:hypothetical protein
MRSDGNLARAKGLLLALMQEAYQRRDHVALLCFAGEVTELRLPPRRAGAWNDDWVAPIAAGGGTPLALGVQRAGQLLAKERIAPALAVAADRRPQQRNPRAARSGRRRLRGRLRGGSPAAAQGAAACRAMGRTLPQGVGLSAFLQRRCVTVRHAFQTLLPDPCLDRGDARLRPNRGGQPDGADCRAEEASLERDIDLARSRGQMLRRQQLAETLNAVRERCKVPVPAAAARRASTGWSRRSGRCARSSSGRRRSCGS